MRKTIDLTIADEGRDCGKVFRITEMSADQAERWAMRAFFALMNAGIDIPEDIAALGFAGIVALGINALGRVPFEAAEPLLAEMMACAQLVPDPSKPNVVRHIIDGDIEEVVTKLRLRKTIMELHVPKLGARSTSDQSGTTAG